MNVRARLEKKLAESFSEPWGTRGVLRPEIVAFAEDSRTGAISGALRFNIPVRSGQEAVAFEQSFDSLRSDEDVDGFLAEALSSLLSVHSSWPR